VSTIKWGTIAAIGAFFISLFLGTLSGNQFLRTFLTAFVFGLIFFGVGFGVRIMINNFFPELMFTGNSQSESDISYAQEPAHASIALENSGEYAVPEMYRIPGKTPELGNIEDLISGVFAPRKESVDSRPEEVYNNREEEASPPPVAVPSLPQMFTPSFGDDEGLGGLPDLDLMATAFSAVSGDGSRMPEASASLAGSDDFFYSAPEPVQKEEEPGLDRTQYKGNKPQQLEGGFDAKEIAQGIRTVLSKDK
jgi:hypothetical protein